MCSAKMTCDEARWIASSPDRRRRAALRSAFTLVELMLSIALGAVLITALGNAFLAGLSGYSDNTARGQLLNAARTCLTDIEMDIRLSDGHEPYDPDPAIRNSLKGQFSSGTVPGDPSPGLQGGGGSGVTGIRMMKVNPDPRDPQAGSSNPVIIAYWFDKTNGQVKCSRQVGSGAPVETVIARGTQDFRLYLQPIFIPYDPQTKLPGAWGLQRAVFQLSMTNQGPNGQPVYIGNRDVSITMTNAAAPRRSFLAR